jgi:hypothetical protein
MRKSTLTSTAFGALILAASFAAPAYATGGGEGGEGGGGGDHTCQGNANCSTTTNNYDNDTTYNKGGTGIGVGIGVGKGGDATNTNNIDNKDFNANLNIAKGGEGGDVKNSGNSFNANINTAKGGDAEVKNSGNSFNANLNKNVNDIDNKNIQGQAQSLENKNYNQDVNNNKNIQGQAQSNKNYNTNAQGQDQKQGQAQGQGQAQAVENVGNVHIENERPPVNTAYSAALATSEDTCMGSSSIGAQAVSFGVTLGTTWTDDNCRRLKNSRQLVALGYHRAATALMCFDEDVSAAMERAGTPCPNGPAVYIAPPPPAREYVPMAPVPDAPVKKRRKKVLPPK